MAMSGYVNIPGYTGAQAIGGSPGGMGGMGGGMGGGTANASTYMTQPAAQNVNPAQQQAEFEATNASLTAQRQAALAQQQAGINNVGGLQAQQQAAYGVATGATNQAAANARGMAAPGQDIFSQKLAGMAQGQFSTDDPSYQWRLQQGQQALERSSAAKGQLGSGNIMTAITDYAQGAASQEYGAQFSRMLQGSQNATSQYGQAYNTLAQMLGGQATTAGTGISLAGAYQGQQQMGLGIMGETINQGQLGINQGRLGLDQQRLAMQQSQPQQGTVYGDLNAQDRLYNISKGQDAALGSSSFGGGTNYGGNYGLGAGFGGNYGTPSSPFSMVRGSDYQPGDTGYGFSPGQGSWGESVGASGLIGGGLANQGWDNSGAPSAGFSFGGE